MKYYKIIDHETGYFMSDTWEEPETLNALKSRFWSFDECHTEKYKDFTISHIEDSWNVTFKQVKDKRIINKLNNTK